MIYIVSHKQFNCPKLKGYIPIYVGGAYAGEGVSDAAGDNIAHKNANFCELTALYWLWKNVDDEYIGLVHYRRYFGKSNFSRSVKDIYTYNELINKLQGHDIVLPYVECFKQSAKEECILNSCSSQNFKSLRDVVQRLYPEYVNDFDCFFAQNKSVLFNMFFCKKSVIDGYCKWLFDILFELEKVADLSDCDAYRQRLYGFLSERLLNVWVKHNGLSAVNLSVVNTEISTADMFAIYRRRITNNICFNIKRIMR